MKKGLLTAFGLLAASSLASATTLTGTIVVFGNTPAISAPSSGSTTAGQFNVNSVNSGIQAACLSGYTCSGATLYEIDFQLTTNVSASVTLQNTSGSVQYIGAIGSKTVNGQANTDVLAGTFAGGATSGVAVRQKTTVSIIDPLSNAVVSTLPTFSIATDVQKRRSPSCSTGTPNGNSYMNCLTVNTGNTVFSGNGTDTQTNMLDNSDENWSNIYNTYVGTGNVAFNIATSGLTDNGGLPTGTAIPINTANVQALSNALQITYLYSYDVTQNPEPSGVPEPSAMMLAGSALVTVGFLRRKLAR